MYAILDTNVLVAGLRSACGASYQILQHTRHRKIDVAVSVSLVTEYESVLLRPGIIPNLAPAEIHSFIDGLCQMAYHQKVFYSWRPFLQDPGDDHILELAIAAGAGKVITHNLRDF